MKCFYVVFLLFFCISCASEDSLENETISFRSKSAEYSKYVSSTCSTDCIWSLYAVEEGFQEKQHDCVEGPCACVVKDDARTLCDIDATPSSLVNKDIEANADIEIDSDKIKEVPYFNQYNNENYGWATCQNTSIAMVLSYFERYMHPDTIFDIWGKDYAQTPSGLNAVYRSYALNSEIYTYTNASPESLRSALQEGFIAIVHGYFTSYGHVIVVRGYDGEYYYVNDPAGKWDGCFKCGYHGSYNGVTKYSKSEFENAVFTLNGTNYVPGWIHLIKKNNL